MGGITMSDIFMSYATADRLVAEKLSAALSGRGWSVWWDRRIPPGRSFDQVITEALDAAKCVVVLWSASSVQSDWVKEEAAEGLRRRILVPAMLDEVQVPLGFRRIQAARLTGKRFTDLDPDFAEFAQSIAALIGRPDSSSHLPADSPALNRASSITAARARSGLRGSAPVLKQRLRRWLFWGPAIGAVAGFVSSVTDRGLGVFKPEEFGTMVGGGAAWGLLGGVVIGLLFGIFVRLRPPDPSEPQTRE